MTNEFINTLKKNSNLFDTYKIYSIEYEEDYDRQIQIVAPVDSQAYVIDKRVISENKLKVLDELMSLIEKHFIALNNKVLFREGRITREQYEKDSGLDEKSYKKMKKLYKQFKSMD